MRIVNKVYDSACLNIILAYQLYAITIVFIFGASTGFLPFNPLYMLQHLSCSGPFRPKFAAAQIRTAESNAIPTAGMHPTSGTQETGEIQAGMKMKIGFQTKCG